MPTPAEIAAQQGNLLNAVIDSMNHFCTIFFHALDQQVDPTVAFAQSVLVGNVKIAYSLTAGSVAAATAKAIFRGLVNTASRQLAWDAPSNGPLSNFSGTLNGVGLSVVVGVVPAA